ncbi:MAG: Rnase Y domain-containing protein, partial [Chloroflexota bacterium]|nr:Rnase Y domain-containing protein [Chloroflexota bacterium]
MDLLIILAALVAGMLVGAIIIHLYNNNSSAGLINKATSESQTLLKTAIKESGDIITSAENKSLTRRKEIDDEIRDRRREIGRIERRIDQREESIDRRTTNIEKIEDDLRIQVTEIEAQEAEINERMLSIQQSLEQIAGLSSEAAKEELLNQLDAELRDESARRVVAMEDSAKAEADVRARKILATVMQRISSEVTTEMTVSVVAIPSDEVKGRIIGREGRNIRAFEAATGCDLIIDDTPGVVTVSAFEPTRREIA